MRRRAHIILTDEDLHHLLALEPGERMVAAWPDPVINGIVIGIEGDETTDLEEVWPGMVSPRIERPYAMVKLRDRLLHVVATMHTYETSGRDAYLRAVGELVEKEIFPHLDIVPDPPDVP
jgi:hypothetical protein